MNPNPTCAEGAVAPPQVAACPFCRPELFDCHVDRAPKVALCEPHQCHPAAGVFRDLGYAQELRERRREDALKETLRREIAFNQSALRMLEAADRLIEPIRPAGTASPTMEAA